MLWLQTAEKAKYDLIFDGLQPVNGMLTGDKVKPVITKLFSWLIFNFLLKTLSIFIFLYVWYIIINQLLLLLSCYYLLRNQPELSVASILSIIYIVVWFVVLMFFFGNSHFYHVIVHYLAFQFLATCMVTVCILHSV